MAQPQVTRDFDHGLFACCDDIPLCLLTWCLPCVPFGRTQSIVESGNADGWVKWCCIYVCVQYCTGLACVLEIMTRSSLRAKYNIDGSMGKDILLALYCLPCMIQQDARQTGQSGCSGPAAPAMK
eukprot:TRINITY_DN1424_c0_g1_i1.p2 TRINITY_DN1424_c0_g1~~TRINITY_DN1424_c0_g1_i1.p2  ORF type:complete len:125 (+),score=4.94 TRINITY_DN1424_c0_g1_i1:55-429(+)